jgi:hypothetical protein
MAWRLRLAQAAAEVSRVKGDGPGARIAARLRARAAREAQPHGREDHNVTGVTGDPPRIHLPDDRGRGKRIPRAGWGN